MAVRLDLLKTFAQNVSLPPERRTPAMGHLAKLASAKRQIDYYQVAFDLLTKQFRETQDPERRLKLAEQLFYTKYPEPTAKQLATLEELRDLVQDRQRVQTPTPVRTLCFLRWVVPETPAPKEPKK